MAPPSARAACAWRESTRTGVAARARCPPNGGGHSAGTRSREPCAVSRRPGFDDLRRAAVDAGRVRRRASDRARLKPCAGRLGVRAARAKESGRGDSSRGASGGRSMRSFSDLSKDLNKYTRRLFFCWCAHAAGSSYLFTNKEVRQSSLWLPKRWGSPITTIGSSTSPSSLHSGRHRGKGDAEVCNTQMTTTDRST